MYWICPSCKKRFVTQPKSQWSQELYHTCSNCRKKHKTWRSSRRKEEIERTRKYRLNHLEETKRKNREYNRLIKEKVMDHYGGKCECCSENRIEFLTIDHIKGGGNKHLKKLGLHGTSFYRWLIQQKFPKEFRILCWNCNFALGAYGYCPHKRRDE